MPHQSSNSSAPRPADRPVEARRREHGLTWIEVALNGPWGPERQPRMPVAVEDVVREGIAAAEAGAAIVHFHAYDDTTGRQKDDWELYARIIEGIRSQVDAIAYPTIPLAGSGYGTDEPSSAEARYRHIDELGKRGLLEWAVVDPGSVNMASFAAIPEGDPGFIYLNPGDHIVEGLRLAARHGFRPSFAIYEPGFTRLGAALAAAEPAVSIPIYRLMFSDQFAWGFPPKAYALEAHLALLQEVAPTAPWMIAGLGVDIAPLIPAALAKGGHVRVGLEDAHLPTDRSNRELVDEAVRLVLAAGRQPATAANVRAALAELDG